jgi:hypothetical protein
VSGESTRIIRPAAILREAEARRVLRALEELDVAAGGVWNATAGLWQRYSSPWDGPGGSMGGARLLGSIGTAYGVPTRYEITIYRATVTEHALSSGWTVESLCDDALAHAGLTLAACPRAELSAPPPTDPFRE